MSDLHLHNHWQLHFWRHRHHPRLSAQTVARLNIGHTLRTMALAMSGMFVPIYLYKLHYTVSEIFIAFAFLCGVWLLALYPVMLLIARFGPYKMMAASLPITATWVILLLALPTNPVPLLVIGAVWGLYVAMYWQGLRLSYGLNVSTEHGGRQVGVATALFLAAGGIAPILSGLIADELGMQVVYMVALGFVMLAIAPLLLSGAPWEPRRLRLRRLKMKKVRRDLLANVGDEVNSNVAGFLWPLVIFLLIPSYLAVGALGSVIVISSILVSLYVGRREEKRGAHKYLAMGAWINAVAATARVALQTAGAVPGINVISGIGQALTTTAYNTKYYQHVKEEPSLEYVFAMNAFSAVGGLVWAVSVALLALLFEPLAALTISLLWAIPASLVMRAMR